MRRLDTHRPERIRKEQRQQDSKFNSTLLGESPGVGRPGDPSRLHPCPPSLVIQRIFSKLQRSGFLKKIHLLCMSKFFSYLMNLIVFSPRGLPYRVFLLVMWVKH